MVNRAEILRNPDYWFQNAQLDLFDQVSEYMERENINKSQLAERLGVNRSFVSQILNGEYNYSLKKLIDICLSIDVVPKITYQNIDDVLKVDAIVTNATTNCNVVEFPANKKPFQLIAIRGDATIPTEPLNPPQYAGL